MFVNSNCRPVNHLFLVMLLRSKYNPSVIVSDGSATISDSISPKIPMTPKVNVEKMGNDTRKLNIIVHTGDNRYF